MTARNPTPGPTAAAEAVLKRHVIARQVTYTADAAAEKRQHGRRPDYCVICGYKWPCDAARLATALLKATEAIDIERIIASDGISEHDGIEHRMTQALVAITDTLGGTDE